MSDRTRKNIAILSPSRHIFHFRNYNKSCLVYEQSTATTQITLTHSSKLWLFKYPNLKHERFVSYRKTVLPVEEKAEHH